MKINPRYASIVRSVCWSAARWLIVVEINSSFYPGYEESTIIDLGLCTVRCLSRVYRPPWKNEITSCFIAVKSSSSNSSSSSLSLTGMRLLYALKNICLQSSSEDQPIMLDDSFLLIKHELSAIDSIIKYHLKDN